MIARTIFALVAILFVLPTAAAMATPSKIIWIPSVDVQPLLVGHLDVDTFFRRDSASAGGREVNTIDVGFTIGVLPYDKLRLEAGFDYLTRAQDPNDQHPWSGNVKLGTPEDAIFTYSPAIAVGLYNARPVKDVEAGDAPRVVSGQNIVYGLVGKTVPELGSVPSLGRFALGYYRGSRRALVDITGDGSSRYANSGLLFSWDRTMREISDQLWLGVDYQGGDNVDSSWNMAFTWKFCTNVSVLFGFDIYTKRSLAGQNTFTIQLDLDFPR
ncbi:hypothetical protein L4X63_07370 [Geomonas sp. Red32]|uniref:hypothetical protein n=1 Tax=Geomonas sp. Red32 TaxID=2912856 RepID=UPI00202CB664|nr:hypothetical protein [Geomonas sp. Red32]MCM0081406.1 hypothetical protein [Geomonas sp. Red32]